jgi:hypothetical protein
MEATMTSVKSRTIPPLRVSEQLRADAESVLGPRETLSAFVIDVDVAYGIASRNPPHIFQTSYEKMKRRSSSKRSQTNFRRLRSMKDKDILPTAEHPEADVKPPCESIFPIRKPSIISLHDARMGLWSRALSVIRG